MMLQRRIFHQMEDFLWDGKGRVDWVGWRRRREEREAISSGGDRKREIVGQRRRKEEEEEDHGDERLA